MESKSKFLRECVVKEIDTTTNPNQIKIHYISFSKQWDEWLPFNHRRIHCALDVECCLSLLQYRRLTIFPYSLSISD